MAERLASVDALDVERFIRDGDTVTWAQACAEPVALTAHVMEHRASAGRFTCFVGLGLAGTVLPEHTDHVRVIAYTGAGRNSALSRLGLLEILPSHYSELPLLLGEGRLAVDVVLVQLSPPDGHGRYSLGLGDEWLSAALERARVVIAEVNDQVPWTHSRLLTAADLDVIVETSHAPVELARREPADVEQRIAAHVGALVEDGDTLATGLGTLPEAILRQLTDHRDLGVHSGAIGDAVVDLVDAGAITNARKPVDTGASVAASLMGTRRLFAFAHENPLLQLRDTRYTHDPARLASIDRFVPITSAFEVDLTGQVNAEVAGGAYIGAVGGAMDFLRGARRSKGGLPIVALPATAGTRSRIVERLHGPVSTPRADGGVIVTEFGAADLRGLTLPERRRRMLAIAHPDHREQLEAAAAAAAI